MIRYKLEDISKPRSWSRKTSDDWNSAAVSELLPVQLREKQNLKCTLITFGNAAFVFTFIFCSAVLSSQSSAQFRFQPNYRPSSGYRPPAQSYSPNPNQYRPQQYPPRRSPSPNAPAQQPSTNQQPAAGGSTPVSALRYAIKEPENPKRFPRLSGEFEPQKAILLSVSDLMYQHNDVLAEIIKKSANRGVPFVILFNDDKQLVSTVELLDSIGCNLDHVSLYRLKLDTIWLRDFGPRFAQTASNALSLDFYYNGQRPLDDKLPSTWGNVANANIARIQWTIQGGNLLSNGAGLAITTSRLFEDNAIGFTTMVKKMDVEFEKRKIVIDAFKDECNIDQLLILEPLQPEATKHVDMFSTFVAKDKIVVARVDPRVDPQNARTLEYNVNLLKQVKVDGKPLQVERIDFPPRNGKYWSPYTNIILVNNLLLMPVYKSDPPATVQNAVDVYRRLLPDCHVETVDMTSMQKLEGALHCMSINVPEFAGLPDGILTMNEARQQARKSGYISKPTQSPSSDLSNGAISSRSGGTNLSQSSPPSTPAIQSNPSSKLASGKPRGHSAEYNATSENTSKNPITSQREKQVAAALTYRRGFIDASNKFTVDAYAIGFQRGHVILLESGKSREMAISIERLSDEDKKWLSLNSDKIRANGKKVKQFVLANQL